MFREQKIKGVSFQADQMGIDQLKKDFLSEARDFAYFRKGEWTGIESSVQHVVEWVNANQDWIPTALALYVPSLELIEHLVKITGASAKAIKAFFGARAPDKKHYVTVRVICTTDNRKRAKISEWEGICGEGGVVTTPKSQSGHFRYLVNEKRYAIFSRLGPDMLQGIMGTDREMILMLREIFDREFIQASIKQTRSRNR